MDNATACATLKALAEKEIAKLEESASSSTNLSMNAGAKARSLHVKADKRDQWSSARDEFMADARRFYAKADELREAIKVLFPQE